MFPVEGKPAAAANLTQAIARKEWNINEGNRAGRKLDIFELAAAKKHALGDSLEVFVEDDALEGFAITERHILDRFEHLGEGNALYRTVVERALADSFDVVAKNDTLARG